VKQNAKANTMQDIKSSLSAIGIGRDWNGYEEHNYPVLVRDHINVPQSFSAHD
jgi:hypothetical protein